VLKGGQGESGPGLYRSTVLGSADAVWLATVVDNVKTEPPRGVAACPADFGSATIIVFGYASGPDADLWYNDGGCETLDNGRIGASEVGNPSFYNSFVPTIDALSPNTTERDGATTASVGSEGS
jgi:hypothetical protein